MSHYFVYYLLLTPVFSSLNRSPSMAMLIIIRCLCSPAALMAIFKSERASWHMRSPRASETSKIPINFALKLTPSPRKREVSFLSVVNIKMTITHKLLWYSCNTNSINMLKFEVSGVKRAACKETYWKLKKKWPSTKIGWKFMQ